MVYFFVLMCFELNKRKSGTAPNPTEVIRNTSTSRSLNGTWTPVSNNIDNIDNIANLVGQVSQNQRTNFHRNSFQLSNRSYLLNGILVEINLIEKDYCAYLPNSFYVRVPILT